MFQILVVEDDTNTRKLMTAVLKENGFYPIPAGNGMEALNLLDNHHIDLVLLDIMMPGMDGYELTKRLRESNYSLPILMVTAKQLPEDKHRGFIVGTDDYMTKPVDEEEMVLRIKALLRRAQIVSERKIRIGDVVLDYDSMTVSRGEEVQELPCKEFCLIYKLLSYPGKIFTRMQLMNEVWGIESESDDSTINTHINRLRRRFETYPEFSIETIRGLGYKAVKHIGI